MTFDEAAKIAKTNPGQGIRDASFQKGWKIVWIKWPRRGRNKAGADFFCINPITGGDYQFRPTEEHRASKAWRLV